MIKPMHFLLKFCSLQRAPAIFVAFFLVAVMAPGSANAQPSSSTSHDACDLSKKSVCDALVQDNILWRIDDPDNAASKHWLQTNLDALCGCTNDPYATVNCFQMQVNNNHKTWQEAIAVCRAKP